MSQPRQPWSAAALRGTEEAGWISRLHEITAACPYADSVLRAAWMAGWRLADSWEESASLAMTAYNTRREGA